MAHNQTAKHIHIHFCHIVFPLTPVATPRAHSGDVPVAFRYCETSPSDHFEFGKILNVHHPRQPAGRVDHDQIIDLMLAEMRQRINGQLRFA